MNGEDRSQRQPGAFLAMLSHAGAATRPEFMIPQIAQTTGSNGMAREKEAAMCCGQIRDRGSSWGYSRRPCNRKAIVERDGKPYCGIHDPERRAAKDAERQAAFRAEQEVSAARFARRKLEEAACRGATDDDLRTIIQEGGAVKILEVYLARS